MNITDNTNNIIEELKKEILLLRRENSDLSAECARLQEIANNALQQNHPEHGITMHGNSLNTNFFADKELLESEIKTLKMIIENMGVGGGELGLGAIGIEISELKRSEKILAQERELFEGIFNNIPVLITLYDSELKNFRFNNEMKRVLGWTEEDASDGNFLEKVYPDPDYRQKVIEFMQSLKTGWQEYTVTTKDGKKVISSWANILLKSGIQIGIGIDIRNRKKSELKLKELLKLSDQHSAELNAVIESMPDAVYIGNKKGITQCNARALQMIGATSLQDLQQRIGELGKKFNIRWPDTGHQLREGELQFSRALNGETVIEEVVAKHSQTGEDIYIRVADAPVIVNGEIIGAVAINSDITDRKQVEEALRLSEEKFRLLFENITEGVALHEVIYENGIPVNYKIINVNRAFEQNCGLHAEIAVGSMATHLYGTKKPPYFKEYLTVATTRKPLRFETYFPSLNKHFIINVVSPKEGQFATVFEDITDQKRNEQEIQQKNEELTRFIYTVSHDLKSPLVTIKSFASFLKSDIAIDDKDALDRDIMYIQNAADKMGKLLDELLELSRIGRKEEIKVKVSLKDIAQSAIDLVAGRISNGNVEVQFVGHPVMLYGHSQRLIQLYQNLLDNAAKFMGTQSHPLIEIGTTIEGDKVILFVRDNGSGIDPRYHHKIFGLFEKLDNSMEGTGIGLALVKRIVEVHGGKIWFSSEGPEKGTTFYFTIERSYVI